MLFSLIQLQCQEFLAETSIPFSTSASQYMTELVGGAYDYVWQVSMNSGFYRILSNVGSLLGLVCLMFFIVHFAKAWLRDEATSWALGELVLPLVVVALLANGGTLMAITTQGLRNTINHYNHQVIDSFNAEIGMQEALAQVADYSSAYNQILTLREQCNVLIQQEALSECLTKQNELAQGIVQEYKDTYTGSTSTSWVTSLANLTQVGQLDFSNPLSAAISIATAGLPASAGSTVRSAVSQLPVLAASGVLRVVEGFLAACQGAFQYVIELGWLVTGLVAPIAVGLSLMPNSQGKPMIAWLTGFLSMGLCKLCLNLITGLFAFMIVKMGPVDALPHAIVIGLLAPVLALLIAAGGGMAVFNGILSATQWVTGSVAGRLQ